MIVCPPTPLLQEYVSVPVPPEALTMDPPLAEFLQVRVVVITLLIVAAGLLFIKTPELAVQLFTSVTEMKYVPAPTEEIVCPVADVLQL